MDFPLRYLLWASSLFIILVHVKYYLRSKDYLMSSILNALRVQQIIIQNWYISILIEKNIFGYHITILFVYLSIHLSMFGFIRISS